MFKTNPSSNGTYDLPSSSLLLCYILQILLSMEYTTLIVLVELSCQRGDANNGRYYFISGHYSRTNMLMSE